MKPRLLKTLLTAACAMAPLALAAPVPAAAQSVMRPSQDIVIGIGNGQLVSVPGNMTDVFVANDSVADVQVKSARQLYVFGKAGGSTTVYASNAAGDTIWSANVRVGSNIDSVDQMLRMAMPEARIGVSTMGTDTFLLTGTIATPEDASEAERLVKAYVGDKANVISRLRMATPLQVNLQVRIAEVSRSLVKTLGVRWASMDNTGGFKFGLGQGNVVGSNWTVPSALNPNPSFGVGTGATTFYGQDPITGAVKNLPGTNIAATTAGTTLGLGTKFLGVDILGALDAGETVGLVTTLAQPNLTALSGETADFLAGGEYPIPISQGLGSTSIDYKKYGVSLSYTPFVLANGRISLRVRPEVSELSAQGAVTLNNFEVPALTIRRAETTVELGSGQSFMIAGLLSNSSQNTIQKMPGAGDVPILGSLFRSTSYRRGETELVIVVTPYLVKPVNANQIALPTDGFRAPNELQRLLGNMSSDGVSGDKRPEAKGADPVDPAAAPGLGELELDTKGKKAKSKAQTASSDSVKPGFNLK